METFLIRALQLIFALSLLVLVHEFGHFLFARIFKVKVDKFYLFFDWKFSLFMIPSKNSKKEDKALIKTRPTKSETEYGIGWIPLGGYCKIAGMIDESMDIEQMQQPAQPWEYRAKPAWQRLLIIVGGVLFNFILALFIYSMVFFAWGDEYYDMRKAEHGMSFSALAHEIGFEDGDIIKSIDGDEVYKYDLGVTYPPYHYQDLLRALCSAENVLVERNGEEINIAMPDSIGLFNINGAEKNEPFTRLLFPAVVDSVLPERAAGKAGLLPGDSIIEIGGYPVAHYADIALAMNKLYEENATETNLLVVREDTVLLTAKLDSTYTLGILNEIPYDITHEEFGFFKAFPAGVKYGVNVLRGYASDFQYVFSKDGAQSVGMFASIGSLFPATWNWHEFWLMTAFLSIILAFMNILPIPAFDGGHAVFLIYEMVTGRTPSDKFMERAQTVGLIIILGLFLLATYNDIMRFLF